jgi:hypothetical protein
MRGRPFQKGESGNSLQGVITAADVFTVANRGLIKADLVLVVDRSELQMPASHGRSQRRRRSF